MGIGTFVRIMDSLSCPPFLLPPSLSLPQERDVSEESGWKLVHGDVFRAPPHLSLMAALVGTGAQLALLVFCVVVTAIVGMLYVG